MISVVIVTKYPKFQLAVKPGLIFSKFNPTLVAYFRGGNPCQTGTSSQLLALVWAGAGLTMMCKVKY